jgi:hypothetical protein
MTINYARIYYGQAYAQDPPDDVRLGAEKQIPFLLQTREHVLYTTSGHHFRRQLGTSEGWRITYTPQGTNV